MLLMGILFAKESIIKIINKEGQLVPFKLNAGQIIVDNVIKELEAKNKPVRLIILKALLAGHIKHTITQ